jgi:sugar/nucleoside kinase (ribokinase family)
MGVCVCTLDETGSLDFPAFYTTKSGRGHKATYNLKNAEAAAKLIDYNLRLNTKNGILIGVPIPQHNSLDINEMNRAIEAALEEAKQKNIIGKNVTPFLLDKIRILTGGESMKSNVALIKNNAKVGAKIAQELFHLQTQFKSKIKSPNDNKKQQSGEESIVVLIGGINLVTFTLLKNEIRIFVFKFFFFIFFKDNTYKQKDDQLTNIKGVTQPSKFKQTLGGVARNMTESLIRLGISQSILISTIGDDLAGRFIVKTSEQIGFNVSKWTVLSQRYIDDINKDFFNGTLAVDADSNHISTGSYCGIFDKNGELLTACGDMRAHDFITPELIKPEEDLFKSSVLCAIDADIPVETIEYICNVCSEHSVPIWYNPTDLRKCDRVIKAKSLNKITYISPNSKELLVFFLKTFEIEVIEVGSEEIDNHDVLNLLYKKYSDTNSCQLDFNKIEMDELVHIFKYLLRYVPFIIMSRGELDLIVASSVDINLENELNPFPTRYNFKEFKTRQWSPQILLFPIVRLESDETICNVTGAGDSASAGFIAGIVKSYPTILTIYNGLLSAKMALLTSDNVSPNLNQIKIDQLQHLAVSMKNKVKKIKL